MKKMTKTQSKKSVEYVIIKVTKLFLNSDCFSTADYIAIDKILTKALKRLQ
jgi:hypothetical protein